MFSPYFRAESIERFYQPESKLISALKVVNVFGRLDILISIVFGYTLIIWPSISTTDMYIFLFHIMHVFSWAAALTVVSQLTSLSYILMTVMVYLVALLGDIGALIWRSLRSPLSSRFLTSALVLNVLLVCIDIALFVTNWITLTWMKQFKDSVTNGIKQSITDFRELDWYCLPKSKLVRTWFSLKILGYIELGIIIIMIVFFGVGLDISTAFSYLLLFQIPHVFLWVMTIGVANRLRDQLYIQIIQAIYLMTIVLDSFSLMWRLVLLIHCQMSGTGGSCGIATPFSWAVMALNFVLIIISLVIIIMHSRVNYQLEKEYQRLAPYIKRRLYQTRDPIITLFNDPQKEKNKPLLVKHSQPKIKKKEV